jgi:hypothetical protein
VDFDKKTWQQDTSALLKTCAAGHVWIFFDRLVPAVVALCL